MKSRIDNSQIGLKIREFRLQAGFTQERLAEELGITFQQIQKYEKGITKVNLVKLQQLSDVLKVPITAFFIEGTYSALQLSNEEKTLLQDFRKIKSAEHRNSILDIVAGLAKVKP